MRLALGLGLWLAAAAGLRAAPLPQASADAAAGQPADLSPRAAVDLSPTAQALRQLERRMAGLNRRLEALEAALRANHYDARSRPGLGGSYRAAWLGGGGSGLVEGEHRSHPQGALNLVFTGSNPNFSLEFHAIHGRRADMNRDQPLPRLGVATYGLGFSYGSADGAWDLRMGGSDQIGTAALVGSAPQALRPDSGFFVDLEAGERPAYATSELGLDLPYGPAHFENTISLRRRAPSAWFPFSDALAYYSQPNDLYQPWQFKHVYYGGLLRLDLAGGLPFVEANALRLALGGTHVDHDRQRAFGMPSAVRETKQGWVLGYENRLRDGTQMQVEVGLHSASRLDPAYVFSSAAHLEGWQGGVVRGLDRRYEDSAWVATFSRPLGFLNLGLEAASIGPFFLPDNSAVRHWMVNGQEANRDANTQVLTPWRNPPLPGGAVQEGKAVSLNNDRDLRWGSDLGVPAALGGNTQRYAFKGQAGWAWFSLGWALGTARQIRPTSYWVRTSPFLESGQGGRLLYEAMSPVYYLPPAPLAPQPAVNSAAPETKPLYLQWKFNRPADGYAVYDAGGNSFPAHWQALSHPSYRDLNLTLLLTEQGLGDPRLAKESVKAANYAQLQVRLNLQDALRRSWPAELVLGGELRDLAPESGLPRLGEPGLPSRDPQASYLTQQVATGMLRWGLNESWQVLLSGGYERWRSDHGYLPLAVEVRSAGVGADLDLAPLLTGLGLFWRSRAYALDDLNLAARALLLWEHAVGTSLSF